MFQNLEMPTLEKNIDLKLDSIEDAIESIRAGEIVIVVDDEDRENEGDFICAAECVTPEIVNFMAKHGRGLICVPLEDSRADELQLEMMVPQNTALHNTAFTVSIDLIGQGCTTGISAYDRATCIRALVDPKMQSKDFARPGHIFPLRAKSGGVLRRTGHTEAAIDLARLAGFSPAGALVEILNEDGSMARLPQLFEIAKKFGLKIISIADLVAYRMETERIVKQDLSVPIQTKFGELEAIAFTQITTGDIHIVIRKGTWERNDPVMVKTFSHSGTGDILGMLLDESGDQLQKAMKMIAEDGKGLLLCMRHSEKNPSILSTLKKYSLQTESEKKLNYDQEMEQRDFGVGAQILNHLDVTKIRLLTNRPKRRIGLIGYGLEIVENVPV